jgi:hypothetical protein
VRGAELGGDCQLPIVDVDGDDRGRPGKPGAGDGGVADATTTEHGDGLPAGDSSGVDRRPEPGHHPAAEQPSHRRRGRAVDLRALPGGDQRLVGEGADPERRRQLSTVLERHLLASIEGVEAVPRLAAAARAAVPAHRPPVEDHEVTRRHLGDSVTDLLDHAGRLVPEEEREFVVDPALAVVQVGVAHAAGLDPDERLARRWVWNDDRLDPDRLALRPGDDSSNMVRHGVKLTGSAPRRGLHGTRQNRRSSFGAMSRSSS